MAKYEGYDFCGWATRNDLRCSDGRTIRRDAFAHQDGQRVPLVWGHNHDSPEAVLGHGYLENRPEGVFFYGYFNDSDLAQSAKRDVQHGDVTSLSIWANQLTQKAGDVLHGSIKEVSLVLAGANMGAQIVYPVIVHGDDCETLMDEAYIYVGDDYGLELAHADSGKGDDADDTNEGDEDMDDNETVQDVIDGMTDKQRKVLSYLIARAAAEAPVKHDDLDEGQEPEEVIEHADDDEDDGDETVKDVLDTLNAKQMKVLQYLVAKAAEGKNNDDDEVEHDDFGGDNMNFNAFEGTTAAPAAYISHADQGEILEVAKKYGSFKEALNAYAEQNELSHDDLAAVSGFTSYPVDQTPAGVDALFPEWHDVRPGAPEIVTNDQGWVKAVLGKVHRSPFSRIRTAQVDLREIEGLDAKGYKKGTEKKLLANYAVAKRTTEPQTVYTKSALNRDDVVDITDFDYVAYQYKIDRMMLEKTLARAILIGDGREVTDDDKIDEQKIRPIWTDNDIFTIHKVISATPESNDPGFGTNFVYASAVEEAILDAKIDYRGSGNMDMFCTQRFFNKIQLAKDLNGRRLYANKGELTSALDVNGVYAVPEFEGLTRTVGEGSGAKTYRLLAIIGNLADYHLGATKGGEITHFTDFDIDFNQYKSLIETRVSGANTRIYSFIVLEEEVTTP